MFPLKPTLYLTLFGSKLNVMRKEFAVATIGRVGGRLS